MVVKHPISITALLVILFAAAQVIGLAILAADIEGVTGTTNDRAIERGATALGERPTTEGFASFLYLVVGVAIGTALVLLLIKFKAYKVWKAWFLIAIWFSLTMALGVFMPATAALLLCLPIAAWKVYWPNPFVHNITEVFMYAGLAVLLVPMFKASRFWATMLLVAVSIYDMIAVWYSKHMVTMAQEQAKSNVFAGLYIPKAKITAKTHIPAPTRPSQPAPTRTSAAILGGGDIAFPLLFSGVVMDWLIIKGAGIQSALFQTTIITLTTTIALIGLFLYAKKDRFYPAMPFLSAGCIVGLGIVLLF